MSSKSRAHELWSSSVCGEISHSFLNLCHHPLNGHSNPQITPVIFRMSLFSHDFQKFLQEGFPDLDKRLLFPTLEPDSAVFGGWFDRGCILPSGTLKSTVIRETGISENQFAFFRGVLKHYHFEQLLVSFITLAECSEYVFKDVRHLG